jgi:hypothetical protein
MKKFFLSLKTQLLVPKGADNLSVVKTIRKWNNQLGLLYDEKGAKTNMFRMPAVFPSFNTADIMQLGEGRQLYNLEFDLHILHWQLDGGAGTFEQDLRVFDLKDIIYGTIQKFQPGLTDEENPAGACVRIAEFEDNQHRGVFHFIQRYKATWVDNAMAEPVGGIDWNDPMPVELQVSTQEKIDAADAYDPLVQYLAVNETYVSQAGAIYVIKLDTPNPAGAFDVTKWTYIEPIVTGTFTPA